MNKKLVNLLLMLVLCIPIEAWYFYFVNLTNLTITIDLEWKRKKKYYNFAHASHRDKRVKCTAGLPNKIVLAPQASKTINSFNCGITQITFKTDLEQMKQYAYMALDDSIYNKPPIKGIKKNILEMPKSSKGFKSLEYMIHVMGSSKESSNYKPIIIVSPTEVRSSETFFH